MTRYAIGDLQGCQQPLLALLDRARARNADARFAFVGDLVNRGPDSLATLRTVHALGDAARVVLGNHDLHFLAVAAGARKPGRSDSLAALLQAPDRDVLIDWLRRQPLARLDGDCLMVHAGVLPAWSAEQAVALSREVEAVLQGPDWAGFLRDMYGNAPAKWRDDLQGIDRLRCIVNALTRMRYCQPDGTIEFSVPEDGKDVPAHLIPWFDMPGRRTENVTVVFGHWSVMGLVLRPNLIGLDTGCVWGGKLTAVSLEDRALVQVNCPQYQQPG